MLLLEGPDLIRWIARRLALALLTLFLLLVAVFAAGHATGNPIALLVPLDAGAVQRAAVTRQLHLNGPILQQLGSYLGSISHGDFGNSIQTGQPAFDLVVSRAWASLQLDLTATVLSVAFALILGSIAVLRPGGIVDEAIRFISVGFMAMPSFMAGLLLIFIFSVHFNLLPPVGMDGPLSYVMPVLSILFLPLAALTRLVRASLLEALGSPYVEFARLKGLSRRYILVRHALPNTLVPVFSFAAVNMSLLIGGAFVVETVFAWPGLGSLAYQAIQYHDFPVIQAMMVVVGIFVIGVSLLMDFVIRFLDPRIREQMA
jgi:peptide/nickel transport system permease protein